MAIFRTGGIMISDDTDL